MKEPNPWIGIRQTFSSCSEIATCFASQHPRSRHIRWSCHHSLVWQLCYLLRCETFSTATTVQWHSAALQLTSCNSWQTALYKVRPQKR